MFISKLLFRIHFGAFILSVLVTDGATAEIDKAYRQAVTDAAFAAEDEISMDLIPINKSNSELMWNDDKSKILVVTWKAQRAYERFFKPYNKTSDNPEYAVWVTTVPQVKRMCTAFRASNPGNSKEAVDQRLRQYLGLNPQWQYDVFVEMWVNPSDIFRPCVDPQIDDKSCDLHFGKDVPKVKNIADYRDFYEDTYYKSFRGSAGVPWTGLGYTYDWGNPVSEVGASEYILIPDAPYEVKRVVPTMEYCSE